MSSITSDADISCHHVEFTAPTILSGSPFHLPWMEPVRILSVSMYNVLQSAVSLDVVRVMWNKFNCGIPLGPLEYLSWLPGSQIQLTSGEVKLLGFVAHCTINYLSA